MQRTARDERTITNTDKNLTHRNTGLENEPFSMEYRLQQKPL